MTITTYDGKQEIEITPKEKAQELLLHAMQVAFNTLSDYEDKMTPGEKLKVYNQMDKQMARVEKLFNYVPHSFGRGV